MVAVRNKDETKERKSETQFLLKHCNVRDWISTPALASAQAVFDFKVIRMDSSIPEEIYGFEIFLHRAVWFLFCFVLFDLCLNGPHRMSHVVRETDCWDDKNTECLQHCKQNTLWV